MTTFTLLAMLLSGCATTHHAAVPGALAQVAAHQLEIADASLAPGDYAIAADSFSKALSAHDTVAPSQRWQYAQTLYRAGRYRQAAGQYEQLVGHLVYGDASIYLSWRCQYQHLLQSEGMDDDHDFAAATRRLSGHHFGSSADLDVPDFGPLVDRRRATLLSDAASVMAMHGIAP